MAAAVAERGKAAYAALEEFVQKLGYGTKDKPVISLHAEGRRLTIVWADGATGYELAVEQIDVEA